MTGQTTLLQAEQSSSPAVFVTSIDAPGSEVLYTTSGGYEGPFNTPTEGFFLTLQPRNQQGRNDEGPGPP
jgi:hypothetical protein